MTKSQTEVAPEIETTDASPPALTSTGGSVTLANGLVVTLKRAVSRPTLKHDSDITLILTINDPIREDLNQEGKEMSIATVLNVEDGREYNYVMNAITASEIADNYPDQSYLGKTFMITKGGTVQGKRYKSITILEVELNAPE